MTILFYLFHVHNWTAADLQDLYTRRDAWQELIRVFSAFEAEKWPFWPNWGRT